MQVTSAVALKEWAVLCARLGAGEQSVLVRKGGLREPRPAPGVAPRFAPEHPSFWLLPTYFHAREAGRAHDLAPAAQALLPAVLSAAPAPGRMRIDLWAEVDTAYEVRDRARLAALEAAHGLAPACAEARFDYRAPGLWVLLLRTYRIEQAFDLPERAEYAGCHSWVDLDRELTAAVTPVITDAEHLARAAWLRAAVEGA